MQGSIRNGDKEMTTSIPAADATAGDEDGPLLQEALSSKAAMSEVPKIMPPVPGGDSLAAAKASEFALHSHNNALVESTHHAATPMDSCSAEIAASSHQSDTPMPSEGPPVAVVGLQEVAPPKIRLRMTKLDSKGQNLKASSAATSGGSIAECTVDASARSDSGDVIHAAYVHVASSHALKSGPELKKSSEGTLQWKPLPRPDFSVSTKKRSLNRCELF